MVFKKTSFGLLYVAVISTIATTTTTNASFVNDGDHGIHVFECDQHLNELSTENRHVKNQGQPFRICFKPFDTKRSRIKRIDSWGWETSYDGGIATMPAIEKGEGNGYTTELVCQPKGQSCYLDTFLPTDFYQNAGAVIGEGTAKLQIKDENDASGFQIIDVEVAKDVFQHTFEVVWTDGPDGDELSQEESQKLQHKFADQEQNNPELGVGATTGSSEL